MATARARPQRPRVACGAGTEHRTLAEMANPNAIAAAYEEQAEAIEAAGGQLILMASRAFTALGAGRDSYRAVYRRLIDGAAQPVILHWLGEMFDPALAGYWGCANVEEASDFVLDLIAENPAKVDGIKISPVSYTHLDVYKRQG